jgi:FlaA1/EpsC-like NDP-sugar epimerase
LVTGAGGSIGSALVNALVGAGLQRLLLLDTSEIGLSELQRQLAKTHKNESIELGLGSIDDADFLDALFSRHRVDLIYHAAAWKQVPLLESHPFSAVRNNALGTHTLVEAAIRGGVPKLVLISTDKAVNPSSIMGVSKRIAELAVVSQASCQMNAIRLCNVIGSSGSVVPQFLRQIAQREPVTVTDPQARRWFLTMHEAVEAILACGVSSQQGKILLPPVGETVRILDLAQFLIRSSEDGGQVAYIGLRPGDKLTEQLIFESERKVGMEGCLTVLETPRLSAGGLGAFIGELDDRIKLRDLPGMLRAIHSVIPEYIPSAKVCEQATSAAAHE